MKKDQSFDILQRYICEFFSYVKQMIRKQTLLKILLNGMAGLTGDAFSD